MTTTLLYMNDFDVTICDAQVASVGMTDDSSVDLILDQTCFYPRGGGQDWDIGTITSDSGIFNVEEVRLDEDSVVHHFGHFDDQSFQVGEAVTCTVDQERRAINTRLHSGGHVVDLAVDRLGLLWLPGKGAHYPHMSFVEYNGDLDLDKAQEIRQSIEDTANNVIATGAKNSIRFMPIEEMHTICRHVPDNIPTHKPARVVVYGDDFGVPCGGTHVQQLNEIGKLTVTKIKRRNGVIKASYAIE